MRRSPSRFAARFLLVLCWVLAASAASAAERAGEDPVAGALRLLEAEVPEATILRWIEAQGGLREPLSSSALIALREAGATEGLLGALLESTRPAKAPRAAREEPLGEGPPPTPPIVAPPAEPAPISRPATGEAANPGGIAVTWDLQNNGPYSLDAEEGELPRDVMVYVDGSLFARLKTAASKAGPIIGKSLLAPGPHVLVLTRDLHEQTSKKKDRWIHEVRVFEPPLRFQIEDAGEVRVEIRYHESSLSRGGPVTVRVEQGEKALLESEGEGTDSARWPRLCEAVDASFAPAKRDSFLARTQRKGCVAWASLWPDTVTTDWQTALATIREGGPTPVP